MNGRRLVPVLLGALTLGACAAAPPDYGAFLDHLPGSILVLPPINDTAEARASDAFLSTVTTPLAERGYYVFPIALVDRMMKENGVTTPGEMHQVPLAKLDEVFGADAVLYIAIRQWTTSYVVIDTSTRVTIEYRLVDVKTGTELWQQKGAVTESSSSGARSPVELLLGALITALVKSASTPEWGLAVKANRMIFNDPRRGLVTGPRHPDHAQDQERRRSEIAKREGALP